MSDELKLVEAIIVREWTLNASNKDATFGSVAKETAKAIVDFYAEQPRTDETAEMKADIVKLRSALEWAKPYVARIRDTQRIDEPLNNTKKWGEHE